MGCGPFGSESTSRGTRRFTPIQSSTVGRVRPAACAMAGMCSSRLVDPPNAACTAIALRIAASVRMSRVVRRRAIIRSTARADRRATSSQIGWPEGASALCGTARPSASATTCDVAAVPRNWQPPPGDAHARQPSSAASSSVQLAVGVARADRLHRAGIDAVGRRQRDAARHDHGRRDRATPASAISIAGRPLSHVATPMTPRRVGSERISRRSTIAASFRYGRLSIMPVVPCVRPSQGSVTKPANGMSPRARSSSAAACISSPTSQWPVW